MEQEVAHNRQQKPFTAEILRTRQEAGSDPGGTTTSTVAGEKAMARYNQLLGEIQDLRKVIESHVRPDGGTEEGHKREVPGPAELRQDLERLRDAIVDTKKEIVALRHPGSANDPILNATDELDAVVRATDSATHAILEGAEKIEELTQRVKNETAEEHTSEAMGKVSDVIISLFEACNFQDITGQRITKVVNTMKFIEERVNAMIEIWGSETLREIEVPKPAVGSGQDARLTGPQGAAEGTSQEDIDKLFD
jgi:chemotaxis protein CheZ